MLFYFIAIIIMLYGFLNYKKSFMYYLAFKLFLVQDITIISMPGIPLLTLEMFMNIFYVLLLWIQKKHYKSTKVSFPFMTPLIMLVVCWSISSVFSIAGIGAEISALIGNILNDVCIIVISWNLLETKEDFKCLFGIITLIIFVSCIYGLIEYTLQFNPLSTYEATLNHDPNRTLNYSYGTEGARGYHVKSIFEHSIGASIIWALYCAFVFMCVISYNERLKYQPLAILTSILCIPLIMLTKQRSGMVLLIILSLLFIKPKKAKSYILLIPVLIGLIFFYDVIADNIQLLWSVFSAKYQKGVSGSSFSMRVEQLNAAFQVMLRSPIWGLGSKYRTVVSDYTISLLRGVESVWFMVLPCYGLIGVAAYLSYVYWALYKIPKFFRTKNLFWLMLGYWFINSVSSLPGFKIHFLFLFVIYILKKTNKYKQLPDISTKEWSYKNMIIRYKKVF